MLLGSTGEKVARRTLMKLTHNVQLRVEGKLNIFIGKIFIISPQKIQVFLIRKEIYFRFDE
jgi:hypothetical protein